MRTGVKGVITILFFLSLIIGCSPTDDIADDPAFVAADGYNGGKLYDQFWAKETGFDQASTAYFDQFPDFFRCVQCHGWDLLGRAGGFAAYNAPSPSRPHVANLNLFEAAKASGSSDLFKSIKTGDNSPIRRSLSANLSVYDPDTNSTVGDQMPNYVEILTDAQIWDIVKFLKTEAVDVKQLYDFTVSGAYPDATVTFSNIGKNGNATQGDLIYSAECSSVDCHGVDGTNGGFLTVGNFFRSMPYREAHLTKFGVLGTDMAEEKLTIQQLQSLFKALADSVKYPN
ncbi:MAG: cytochrome c [Chitinispirillaceae bacterium]|nr:cytochrome c [Chitinispirillaceae bacterium]